MLEFASSLEHIGTQVFENFHLDHDEVLLDLSVVREATHWVDGLVSNVIPVGFELHQWNNLSLHDSPHIFRKSE